MFVLHPGDKIHLAFPLTPRSVPQHEVAKAEAESVKEAENSIAFYRSEYAALGVEIPVYSASQSITVPTVVAVFRTPAPFRTPAAEVANG